MSDLLRDVRHGVRLLKRTPGFTAVAVLVLALGIGANTAVFSIVNALVLQPRQGRIDQVLGVFSRDRTKPDHYRDFSYPAYLDMRARSDIFDSLMAHTFSTVGITEGDVTKQTFASIVSANYFSTLGVHLAAGRAFSAEEERPGSQRHVAIASYAVWRRKGLDPAFVGSIVRVSGTDYTVIGVTPRGFAGTMTLLSPEWWFPLGSFDTIVNEHLIREGGLDIANDPVIGLVVETGCTFRKPLTFPEQIDAAMRVTRVGTSSVTYEIALFREDDDEPAATGRFVHVWVDRATQRPVPIPARIRAALAPLVVDAAAEGAR